MLIVLRKIDLWLFGKNPSLEKLGDSITWWTKSVYKYRIMNAICRLHLKFLVLQSVLCTVDLARYGVDFFMEYSVIYLMGLFDGLTTFLLIYHRKTFEQFDEFIRRECYPLEQLERSFHRELVREFKIAAIFVNVMFPFVFASAVSIMILNGTSNHFYYALFAITNADLSPIMAEPLKYLYLAFSPINLAYSSFTFTAYIIYYTLQVRGQCAAFGHLFERLAATTSGLPDSELVANGDYQRIVMRRLVEITKQHLRVNRLSAKICDFLYVPMFFMLFLALGVQIFLAYSIFMIPNDYSFALVGFFIFILLAAGSAAHCGQMFSDFVDDMFAYAFGAKWETFNPKNRVVLSFMYMNMKRKFALSGMGIVVINYPLYLWFSRTIFSMFTLLNGSRSYKN